MRQGKVFIIRDRGKTAEIILQPIRPRGWVITRNLKPIYEGKVMQLAEAEAHLRTIKDYIVRQQGKSNQQHYDWLELARTVPPIDPPLGTLISTIPTIDIEGGSDGRAAHVCQESVWIKDTCCKCWLPMSSEASNKQNKKGETRMGPIQLLPAHYQESTDRIAEEEELLVVVTSAAASDNGGTHNE